jgi:hypothetical protein
MTLTTSTTIIGNRVTVEGWSPSGMWLPLGTISLAAGIRLLAKVRGPSRWRLRDERRRVTRADQEYLMNHMGGEQ